MLGTSRVIFQYYNSLFLKHISYYLFYLSLYSLYYSRSDFAFYFFHFFSFFFIKYGITHINKFASNPTRG